MKKKTYKVTSKVVLWAGAQGNWHFAGVDGDAAKELRETYGKSSRGFGSLPVDVVLGKTVWETSIFWDSRSKGYILPLKASVRKAEDVFAEDEIAFTIRIRI